MSEESRPADATAAPGGTAGHDGPPRYPAYAERVLEVADLIPPGRVMTYGDVAEWLEEGGPRQVGRVMALYGGAVPWWRVIRADGVLLPGHEPDALGHYRAEGTPLRASASSATGYPRVDVRHARWDGHDGQDPQDGPDGPDHTHDGPDGRAPRDGRPHPPQHDHQDRRTT
ncbi:MGMT family protein [Streptomyces sp. JNUCC 64]